MPDVCCVCARAYCVDAAQSERGAPHDVHFDVTAGTKKRASQALLELSVTECVCVRVCVSV